MGTMRPRPVFSTLLSSCGYRSILVLARTFHQWALFWDMLYLWSNIQGKGLGFKNLCSQGLSSVLLLLLIKIKIWWALLVSLDKILWQIVKENNEIMCNKKNTLVTFGIVEPITYTILPASSPGPHQNFSYIGLSVWSGITFITSGQNQREVGLERLMHDTETRSRKSVRKLICREPSPRTYKVSRKLR